MQPCLCWGPGPWARPGLQDRLEDAGQGWGWGPGSGEVILTASAEVWLCSSGEGQVVGSLTLGHQ